MVRLSPPAGQRLDDARQLDVHVGGSELNVAAGAARLGLRTRWVSRLAETPRGRLIACRAGEAGGALPPAPRGGRVGRGVVFCWVRAGRLLARTPRCLRLWSC